MDKNVEPAIYTYLGLGLPHNDSLELSPATTPANGCKMLDDVLLPKTWAELKANCDISKLTTDLADCQEEQGATLEAGNRLTDCTGKNTQLPFGFITPP